MQTININVFASFKSLFKEFTRSLLFCHNRGGCIEVTGINQVESIYYRKSLGLKTQVHNTVQIICALLKRLIQTRTIQFKMSISAYHAIHFFLLLRP